MSNRGHLSLGTDDGISKESMQAVHEAEGKDTNLSMLCTLLFVGYLNAFLNV